MIHLNLPMAIHVSIILYHRSTAFCVWSLDWYICTVPIIQLVEKKQPRRYTNKSSTAQSLAITSTFTVDLTTGATKTLNHIVLCMSHMSSTWSVLCTESFSASSTRNNLCSLTRVVLILAQVVSVARNSYYNPMVQHTEAAPQGPHLSHSANAFCVI